MANEYITIQEAIELLECCRSTLYNQIRKGAIKPYGNYLGKTVFLKEDVLTLKQNLLKKF